MDDLISRAAAIKAIDDLPNCHNGYSDTYDKAYIIGVLEELPTIDPVKHGKWIDGKYMGFDGCFVWHRECSECGYERDDDDPDKDTNYCPNCGADMRETVSPCDGCDKAGNNCSFCERMDGE